MRGRMALLVVVLVILPSCAHYREGPRHAGLRALIYETTPTALPARGKFEERPKGPKAPAIPLGRLW